MIKSSLNKSNSFVEQVDMTRIISREEIVREDIVREDIVVTTVVDTGEGEADVITMIGMIGKKTTSAHPR